MNPMNQGAKAGDINVEARYRTMLTLWLALLASVGLYFFLTLMIERPATGDDNMLFWVFLTASVMPLVISFLLKHKLLAKSVAEQRPELVQSAMILALGLSEMVALFGLLVFFTTGTHYYYLFFIISAAFMLLHMPRKDQLLAASYKGHAWDKR
jgi:hypothetical protein